MAEFNEEMKTKGLNGKILTVESLPYEATKDWKIDTETSLSTFSNKNVFNVRIFYEKSDTLTFPQIGTFFEKYFSFDLFESHFLGIEDFFPNQITRATFFKKPTFETFDKVIERGFSWLQQNPLKRFINAQSIDIKMKSRMLFDCVLEHTALLCLRCRLITLLKSILLCCHQPVQ